MPVNLICQVWIDSRRKRKSLQGLTAIRWPIYSQTNSTQHTRVDRVDLISASRFLNGLWIIRPNRPRYSVIEM